jgi:cytoskeletal protein CcmA (bactofilin family)
MKFKRENAEEILSILGEGVELQGELSFVHGIRVDGTIRGKIRSESYLVIGPKGNVQADVTISKILISGEFRGSIHASDRVEINKDGKVYGDLYTPCLIIEAGALFEGKCNMNEQHAAVPPVPASQTGA